MGLGNFDSVTCKVALKDSNNWAYVASRVVTKLNSKLDRVLVTRANVVTQSKYAYVFKNNRSYYVLKVKLDACKRKCNMLKSDRDYSYPIAPKHTCVFIEYLPIQE